MTRLQLSGRRLVIGHRLIVARLTDWVTERRDPKSTASRAAILAATGWVLWQTIGRSPAIMWALALGWTIAAWRAGKPTPAALRRQVLEGVLDLIGERPGIFLAELYPALRARPAAAHLDDARLRAVLEEAGLTIHKAIRIGKDTGRSGVKRKDVEALLSPDETPAPSEPVDAGQSPAEGAVEAA